VQASCAVALAVDFGKNLRLEAFVSSVVSFYVPSYTGPGSDELIYENNLPASPEPSYIPELKEVLPANKQPQNSCTPGLGASMS